MMPVRADPYDDTPEGAPPVPRTMASVQAHEVRRLRSSHQYQALRAQFRQGEELRWVDGRRGAPCWLCGTEIDYRLCVAPETLVLCTDLTWRTADSLPIGEFVIAFDEMPQRTSGAHAYRKFRSAALDTKQRLIARCVELTTDDGTSVVCSTNHRWLILSGKTLRWKRAGLIRLGDTLISVGEPWSLDLSRESGYLAGIFDGEGHVSTRSRQIGFSQLPGPVLDRATDALKALGHTYTADARNKDAVISVRPLGGVWELVRLLGQIEPVRLLPKAHFLWEGAAVSRSGARKVRVISVADKGEREVIALGTSEATFIANGLLSHNSHPHPYSWSLDHALSVHERPDLLMDVGNFRSAHLDCNNLRGTDDPALDIGIPSEIW